jgi:hypothetical protein
LLYLGGGPCGADDAADAFTTFGVFAFTFAAVLSNVGYADADADAAASAAAAGAGDFEVFGDFAGFGAFAVFGGFSGFCAGVCFIFDACRRLDASICKSLGSGFPISAAYVFVGLLAALAVLAISPVLLDLAFDAGAGSDDGLMGPFGALPALSLIAASLVAFGKKSIGICFVAVGGSVVYAFSGAGEAVFPTTRFRSADIWRKKPPRYVVFCAACVDCFSGGGARPYVFAAFALPLPASSANLATKSGLAPISAATFLRIASSLMVFCLAVSVAILSVSAFASAIASSTPEPRCADSAFAAAGADDEEAAVDAAAAVGPRAFAGPFGDGPMCVSGSPRAGRGVPDRFGPTGAGPGTTGGLTNVCPKCGPV